jgi:osmotically-inducible protein OsmY
MKKNKNGKVDVEQVLFREPSVHAERIGVTANGCVIKLDGNVGSYSGKWAAEKAALSDNVWSWAERDEAERRTSSAPGGKIVEDRITIR